MLYQRMTSPEQRASNCIDCGECEKKCPQQIPIAKELKKVHEALAGRAAERVPSFPDFRKKGTVLKRLTCAADTGCPLLLQCHGCAANRKNTAAGTGACPCHFRSFPPDQEDSRTFSFRFSPLPKCGILGEPNIAGGPFHGQRPGGMVSAGRL